VHTPARFAISNINVESEETRIWSMLETSLSWLILYRRRLVPAKGAMFLFLSRRLPSRTGMIAVMDNRIRLSGRWWHDVQAGQLEDGQPVRKDGFPTIVPAQGGPRPPDARPHRPSAARQVMYGDTNSDADQRAIPGDDGLGG
jgi:hypothetical protein